MISETSRNSPLTMASFTPKLTIKPFKNLEGSESPNQNHFQQPMNQLRILNPNHNKQLPKKKAIDMDKMNLKSTFATTQLGIDLPLFPH